MAQHINLTVHRLEPSARSHGMLFALLALPLALGLGFVAFRTRRLRPLATAWAILGIARSAANMLTRREHEAREHRIDRTVEDSFPASDASARQP